MAGAGSLPGTETDPVLGCAQALDEAAALSATGEFRAAADAALRAGELARLSGRPDLVADAALLVPGVPDPSTAAAVERLCTDALALLDGSDVAQLARLHGQLSIALHHRERFGEAERHAREAEELAGGTSDPLATAAAVHARQLTIAGMGPTSELVDLGRRMLEAAAVADSLQAEVVGRGWLIDALMRQGDAASAAHEIDSLDVLAARSGDPLVRWNALLARAGLDHTLGRFDEAVELAAAARGALPKSQRRMTEPLFVAQVMLVATDRGTEPTEIALARDVAVGAPPLAIAMTGRYDLELGDETGARVAYEAVRTRVGDVAMDRRGLPTLTATLELAAHFQDLETAAELTARLEPFDGLMIASALGAVGPVAHFLGKVQTLLGSHDDAVAHAEAAAGLMARAGFGPWLARSRLALAEALVARSGNGDRESAGRSATLALTGARRLGMKGVAYRADRLLTGLTGSARLTPREREIAALVADGSSNREIAATLVLSDRTVETHVQNILTKLGFHARTQIAGWAVAEGLAGPGRT